MDLQRRNVLIGLTAGAVGAVAASQLGVFGSDESNAGPPGPDWIDEVRRRDRVSVTEFRAAGDPDDTGAFLRAVNNGRTVHVPAGGGSAPDGAYRVGIATNLPGGNLRSKTAIEGDGIGRTVLRHTGGDRYVFHGDSGSPDPARNIADLVFRDLTLQADVSREGFREHVHLINLNGVSSVLIERVEFRGFLGDGLMLGTGANPQTERHNRSVTVQDCVFDGVNNDNRNAISVLDVDGLVVENCQFRNCTRPNMPGAIDFEPEHPSALIRNIRVERCTFDRIGGGVAVINLTMQQGMRMPANIAILGNVFENYAGRGNAVSLNIGREPTPADPSMAVTIRGNRGTNGGGIYGLVAAKGVVATDNEWQDYGGGILVGYVDPGNFMRDATISDRFVRCGRGGGGLIRVYNVAGLTLDGSQFLDCGSEAEPSFAVVLAQGKSERVSLQGVRVASLRGRGSAAVTVEPGHRLDRSSNVMRGNDFGGFPSVAISGR